MANLLINNHTFFWFRSCLELEASPHYIRLSVCFDLFFFYQLLFKEFCHPCLKEMEWKVISPNPKNCSNWGHFIKINFFDICSTVLVFMMTRIVEDGSWMLPREKWTLDSTAPSGTGTGSTTQNFLYFKEVYSHKILQFNII